MYKVSFPRLTLLALLSLAFCSSAFAQIYPPGVVPPASTTPTTTSSAPSPAGAPGTNGVTTVSAASFPGYAVQGGYGPERTIAYAIAPFAVLGATYLLGHHQVEIHPNAGFVWPGSVNFGDTMAQMRNEGIYGVKAGVFLNDTVEVEGNVAYMNHFESKLSPTLQDQAFGIQPHTVYGLLYDVNGLWNFGPRPIFGSRISPYIVAGIGGLSTEVRGAGAAVLGGQFYQTDPATGASVLNPTHTVVVHDNTAFFSVNYGGGIKAANLWGPVGLRADIRGRTFPNFRGESLTWPEATAGLTFSFGEK